MTWLPDGKTAALCFSVDDVHPSSSADGFEAGGELSRGQLGLVEALLERHPKLKVTLFVTPDWRPIDLVSQRPLASLPGLSSLLYHVDLHPSGRFRVDRFPDFVRYLNGLERAEVAPHGLHHIHRGARLSVEYQCESVARCRRSVARALSILDTAGLNYVRGFAPPGWNLPDSLVTALTDLGFRFVCSARDIESPIAAGAENRMSGRAGVSILEPQLLAGGQLVHVPVNFQATSCPTRADAIIACGGLISVKAHIFKEGGGFRMRDGLDREYFRFLDDLFGRLEARYGDSLWWTSMNELSAPALTASSNQEHSDEGRHAVVA